MFATFLKFKAHAGNLLSSPIKQFQADNRGEYLSKQFRIFLSKFGIYHRLTCLHTPQQKGIVERKHHHIQELGLGLLAQSHLKQKFWVDAFQMVVYLINKLPTKVLQNRSPIEVLNGKASSYSTS